MICEKEIKYYINRTDYPLGLSQKIWPAVHVLHKNSASWSFWDAFDLKLLIIMSSNSLMMQMIQQKRLRETLLLTSFESLSVTMTVGRNKIKSPSKICMCGTSTQEWPSTQIPLFERTRQSGDSTLWWYRWEEANEFLCTKVPLLEGVE